MPPAGPVSRVGARHDLPLRHDVHFPPSVIPGKRSATRNPFPMRYTSAQNGASVPRRHHATLLFGLKGFRRFHIVTHSARSRCRVGARHDSYIKPGMTFVDPGMTSPLPSFRTFSPLCHSGQAQRDPESISNASLFSQKRRISSQTTLHNLFIWPEGVSLIPYRNAFSEVWMPGRSPA